MKKLLWFAALYCASVVTLGILAFAIRAVLKP